MKWIAILWLASVFLWPTLILLGRIFARLTVKATRTDLRHLLLTLGTNLISAGLVILITVIVLWGVDLPIEKGELIAVAFVLPVGIVFWVAGTWIKEEDPSR